MEQKFKFSDQCLGAIMLALQKGMLEQIDITDIMKAFEIVINDKNEIVVLNPPTFEIEKPKEEGE